LVALQFPPLETVVSFLALVQLLSSLLLLLSSSFLLLMMMVGLPDVVDVD
jgi:hypothetical protein